VTNEIISRICHIDADILTTDHLISMQIGTDPPSKKITNEASSIAFAIASETPYPLTSLLAILPCAEYVEGQNFNQVHYQAVFVYHVLYLYTSR
jgi:hypothetical protein